MINYNDSMLFPNAMKQRKIEKANYIELEKYSRKMYKRDIISNLIVFTIMTAVVVAVGAVALCGIF